MPPSVSSPVARATVPRDRAATDGTLPIDSARVVDDESALHWDWRCDVLVVGFGAAGASVALAAHERGDRQCVGEGKSVSVIVVPGGLMIIQIKIHNTHNS